MRSFYFIIFVKFLQRQLHKNQEKVQYSSSKEIEISFTNQIRHVFTVLTTSAPFEHILSIPSYIWILTLLLHTFFPPLKYAAVEPENKHSLKSQIKLSPNELQKDLILHSTKSVEVLITDHTSKWDKRPYIHNTWATSRAAKLKPFFKCCNSRNLLIIKMEFGRFLVWTQAFHLGHDPKHFFSMFSPYELLI